jgi:hypothetical protein
LFDQPPSLKPPHWFGAHFSAHLAAKNDDGNYVIKRVIPSGDWKTECGNSEELYELEIE